MNINDLTLGQAKELAAMFQGQTNTDCKKSLFDYYIGKYVIVRSRNEGINFGKVKQADETGIIIEDARRIWHHRPKDKSLSWYEGVATSGVSKDSKLSNAVQSKVIIEDYSITICTDEATKSMIEAKSNEQS